MEKIQIKSEKLTLFEEYFQSWSNLTPHCNRLDPRSKVQVVRLSVQRNYPFSHDNKRRKNKLR